MKLYEPSCKIHPTALIEEGVQIGSASSIWDNVHIRKNSHIGHHTSIGEKTYIAYDVRIGSYVKINAMVYICTGVTIEDMCMISAGTVFTNDLFPRAMNKELTDLETSDPTSETLQTCVRQGSTIGANATIGPGVTLGRFSMIGMGAVVTKSVPDHGLAVGNPARVIGYVCICGPRLINAQETPQLISCPRCARKYRWENQLLTLQNK